MPQAAACSSKPPAPTTPCQRADGRSSRGDCHHLRASHRPVGLIYSFSALTWNFTGCQRVGATIGETGELEAQCLSLVPSHRLFLGNRRSIWTQQATAEPRSALSGCRSSRTPAPSRSMTAPTSMTSPRWGWSSATPGPRFGGFSDSIRDAFGWASRHAETPGRGSVHGR